MVDATMNDIVTVITAVLSGVIFPYLSKTTKDMKEQQKQQMDILIAQNRELHAQNTEFTNRILELLEKKV